MVDLAAAGSYDARFEVLFALAARSAARVVRDRSVAEELAQDTMLLALAAWDEIHSFAESWVTRVAVNRSIDYLRRQRSAAALSPSAVDDPRSPEVSIDMRRALLGLPLRQRQVTVLRHIADLPEREVADLLGITVGSVKRHLARGLAALKKSPMLNEGATDRTEMGTDWSDVFTAARTPPGGWPPRPWDHRYLSDDAGSVDRVAVDQSGRVILDADGDEVQSGPGFDYQPVKVRRGDAPVHNEWTAALYDEWTPPTGRLTDGLAAAVRRAAELADVLGHPWIGEEHLALALLEVAPESEAILGASWGSLLHAIAEFYEGPDARARVSLVHQRLRSGWRPTALVDGRPAHLNHSLRETLRASLAGSQAATVADAAKSLVMPRGEESATHTPLVPALLRRHASQERDT